MSQARIVQRIGNRTEIEIHASKFVQRLTEHLVECFDLVFQLGEPVVK